MHENLLGYLLKALDPVTHREVEGYVRENPEAHRHLELLRQALTPLAEDRGTVEVPPGLRHATLARVAEYRCRDLPHAPPPPSRATLPLRSWYRWPDALVAATILFVILSMLPIVRYRLLFDQGLLACKNNLRLFHQELMTYAGLRQGDLPMIQDEPPFHVAGVYIVLLGDRQQLPRELSVACPNNMRLAPSGCSLTELDALYRTKPQEYYELTGKLGGCYAYGLGYRDAEGRLHGMRCRPGADENDRLAIMADRPPFDRATPATKTLNSRNHDSRGQNVLFMGGEVQFATHRTLGIGGDDIYVSDRDRVEAGLRREDAVLGASAVKLDKPW